MAVEQLLTLIQQYGTEISLLVTVLFAAYQMYSPNTLPDTKAQKLVSSVLSVLEELNSGQNSRVASSSSRSTDGTTAVQSDSQEGDGTNTAPNNSDEQGGNNTTPSENQDTDTQEGG